jgi:hypothetical protein
MTLEGSGLDIVVRSRALILRGGSPMRIVTFVGRVALGVAVGIAVLVWGAPARAGISVTITDSFGGVETYNDSAFPGLVSVGPVQIGDILVSSFSVNANYNNPSPGGFNATPGPGTIPAYIADIAATAQNIGTVADTLIITVTVSGPSSGATGSPGGAYTIPGGSPLFMTEAESSSNMTSNQETSAFQSSLTSINPFGSVAPPNSPQSLGPVTITGPASGSKSVSSPNGFGTLVTNPGGSFNLSNSLVLSFGSAEGNAIGVTATTDVVGVAPEPATLGVLLSGVVLTFMLDLSRRPQRRA